MTETLEPSVCPWPVDPACMDEWWDSLDDDVKDRATALASATLHRLTGYRVGGCPITVRPCKKGCDGWSPSFMTYGSRGSSSGYWPVNWEGVWINSCGCSTDCSCTALCELSLPEPVGEVLEVRLDGAVVDPTDYRVDGSALVWVGDAECAWPTCQDMAAPLTAPDTFAVTYLNSYPVDSLGAYAAGILAMEYAKACTGGKCRLPATVTSISRQGVSFDVPSGSFPNGFTGIREVDAYISMWNPGALRQRASVWTPDRKSPRVIR